MKVQRLGRMAVTAGLMLVVGVFLARCSSSTDTSNSTAGTVPYIYVASGTGYAGSTTTMLTASNTITKYNSDGSFNSLLVDYTLNTGDSPVGLVNYDAKSFLVAVENATNVGYRRIDRVYKDGSGIVTFLQNGTAFGSTAAINPLTALALAGDGGYLIGVRNSTANFPFVEKLNGTKVRVTSNAGTQYVVNSMAGSCALTTAVGSRYNSIVIAPTTNHIIVAHSAPTTNNKILMINTAGYNAAADCISAASMPSTTHIPTALVMHSTGKLLAGFSYQTAPAVNQIYSYDVTATAISNGVQVYNNPTIVLGISAMTEKMDDKNVLVANAISTYNTIERFSFDGTTFARVGTAPYIAPSIYTRSVSAILAPVAE